MPAGSSSFWFVGRLDDIVNHDSYPGTRDQHNTEVTKLQNQITQAKEDLAAEEARMTEERASLDAQSQQI